MAPIDWPMPTDWRREFAPLRMITLGELLDYRFPPREGAASPGMGSGERPMPNDGTEIAR